MRYLLFFLLPLAFLEACTGFQLISQDSARVYCRSLEFALPLDSNLLIVPRGTAFVGSAPNQKKGLPWNVKYGYVGMNQSLARTMIADGMNEKGLVAGSFYLPGFAKYETSNPSRIETTLGAWELPSYLLATCATVDEVKAALPKILVAEQPTPGVNFSMPLHFYVGDAKGQTIVIEYLGGRRYVYDNPLGVLTNSPSFDWHKTNLSNYLGLSPVNRPPLSIKTEIFQGLGQGSGLLGLPGDYTPPSRFVRAALFSNGAALQKNAQDTVLLGFHLLNTFDIFEGIVRSEKGELETTQWTVIHDMTNLKTYFRSYQSLQVQQVDLTRLDFSRSGFRQIAMNQTFSVSDDTDKATPLPK
jgi:choloylglycine hydrolase